MLDAFHLVKLAQTALDEVRRRRQQEQLGRRGHTGDPLYRARRDLRRGLHTHTVRSWARTELALTDGDLSPQLLHAFQVSYELHRLALTLDARRSELLTYWISTGRRGVSNGPTEAINCLIKKVKRSGHGFRNLQNDRLRLLLNVGLDWLTVTRPAAPATPIRRRQPR